MKNFYKGAFQPYLETAFIDELSRLRRHPLDEVLVFVPSSLLAQQLRREVTRRTGGIAGLKIIDIEVAWKSHISKALLSRKLRHLPSRAAIIYLKRSAQEALKDGDRLYSLLKFRGLPQAIWNTIRDLKEARITFDDLEKAAGKMPDPKKIVELARVWKKYEEMKTGGGFCDDKDRQLLALEDLKAESPRLDSPFFIYGIYDVTHLQKEFIRAYVSRNDAIAFVPFYKQQSEFTAPFIDFLYSEGFQEEKSNTEISQDNPLADLSERMFSYSTSAAPISRSSEIELIAADGTYAESRETVRVILKWCRERDIAFDEVAIILRNDDLYRPLFREVLKQAELPYRTTKGEPLSRTPGGRSLGTLASLIIPAQRTQRAIADFLEGAPLLTKNDDASIKPSLWMSFARQAFINDWTKDWEKRLLDFSNSLKEKRDHERDKDLPEDTDKKIEEINSLIIYMKRLFRMLDDIPHAGSWLNICEKVKIAYQACIDRRAWGVVEAIALLDDFMGMADVLGKCDIREFFHALNDELMDRAVSGAEEKDHGMVIADILRARSAPFRAVAIPGLYHSGFPAPYREDPLLLDEERTKLGDILKHRHKPELKGRRAIEEKFLFLLAIGSARERLVLSYPKKDAVSEKPIFPSSIFVHVFEALGHGPVENTGYKLEDDALDETEALLYTAKHRPEIVANMPLLTPGRTALKNRKLDRLSIYDGIIKDETVLQRLIERFKKPEGWLISPRRMEEYAECPFKFFMEYVLELETMKETEEREEIAAVDRGTLCHAILSRFYKRMRDECELPFSPDNADYYITTMREMADAEFERREQEGIAVGMPLMWEFTKRQIVGDIEEAIIEDSKNPEWTPSFFEVSIGSEYQEEEYDKKLASEKPIPIRLDEDTRILVKGRIDRIDLNEGTKEARIIDYKTGSSSGYGNNKLAGGSTIQVPLYCLVAEELLKKRDRKKGEDQTIKVSEGCYWFVNKKKAKARGAKRVKFTETNENVRIALKLIIRCIERGLFHQYAKEKREAGRCLKNCEFARACLERANDISSRKKDDESLEAWNKLKEIE